MCGHIFLQHEARLERQEDRLHMKAAHAALHGNIGKALVLEVSNHPVCTEVVQLFHCSLDPQHVSWRMRP